MSRQVAYLFITILSLVSSGVTGFAMDFGLRFKSNTYSLDQRTSLTVGNGSFDFKNHFKVGFFFNLYPASLFGNLATIRTDDGHVISAVVTPMGGDKYKLGLVVDDHMTLIETVATLNPDQEDHVDITISKSDQAASLRFNNDAINLPLRLSKDCRATVKFGIDSKHEITDVAPMELRKIRIFIDEQNTNHWDLKYHNTPTTSIDDLGGMVAEVKNPHWLIDDHTDWALVYQKSSRDRLQTAFDPRTEEMYLVDDTSVKKISMITGDSAVYEITGGRRPMAYSNHLLFDTVTGNLLNYNLLHCDVARFDFDSRSWIAPDISYPDDESHYSNHAIAVDGDVAYTFGGYGFYNYHNDFFKINLRNCTIQKEPAFTPEMMPMTSSAAAVVDNKLYIFGGRGNESGRQELPSKCRYTLYAYNLDNHEGHLVWELDADSLKHQFLPSQTMYYDPQDDSFVVALTVYGGQMVKIGRSKPYIKMLSVPIEAKMEFHDCVFDLYRSADGKHYYLVFDRRMDPEVHDYFIYTISTPFIDDPELIYNKSFKRDTDASGGAGSWIIYVVAGVLVVALVVLLLLRRRKRSGSASVKSAPAETVGTPVSAGPVVSTSDAASRSELPQTGDDDGADAEANSANVTTESEAMLIFDTPEGQPCIPIYNRNRASISLLGNFAVRSKTGEDITMKFTSRLKSLLILLLLQCTKNENGIKYQAIDELIWGDKDEKSAQNNRNVYMRKLRVLLEEIGDIPVIYDKGYFTIDTSSIMFDYREAMAHIAQIKSNAEASPQMVNETLELLLMGPLLPSTSYDWLDNYKAEYSDCALALLNRLLAYELECGDDKLAYRIAMTISLHEPLSEEAMKAKCRLLSKKGMVATAQNVYNKFCKEYKHSMGEAYDFSFVEITRH